MSFKLLGLRLCMQYSVAWRSDFIKLCGFRLIGSECHSFFIEIIFLIALSYWTF